MQGFVPAGINPEGVTSASTGPHHSRSVPLFDKLRANGAEFPSKFAKCGVCPALYKQPSRRRLPAKVTWTRHTHGKSPVSRSKR